MAVEQAILSLPPGAWLHLRQQGLKARPAGPGFVPGSLHCACYGISFDGLVAGRAGVL
jgi:hypothetical protein